MFVHIPKILNCEGWERNCDESSDRDFDFANDSIEILVNWFKVPLENGAPYLFSVLSVLLSLIAGSSWLPISPSVSIFLLLSYCGNDGALFFCPLKVLRCW